MWQRAKNSAAGMQEHAHRNENASASPSPAEVSAKNA